MWGAVREAIKRQLLPQRALASLKSFHRIIEDARAMLYGKFENNWSSHLRKCPMTRLRQLS